MSEEEIIMVLENHAQYTNAIVIDANTKKDYKVSEALQGLLDLYNKEKEKNKGLNATLTLVNIGLDNYISKDKIKEKIKELEDLNSEFSQRVIKSKEVYLTELVQNILKELLGDDTNE